MASSSSQTRPGLRFIWLGIITAVLAAIVGGGIIWSDASATPELALDLEGGTSIVLEPQLDDGESVTQEQLDQAVAIIRQRVDSTGVSEAEITTEGGRNIVVNLPGNPDEETRELVRASAQLNFRPVITVGAPEPLLAEETGEPAESEAPELSEEDQKRLDDVLGPEEGAATEETAQPGGTVPGPAAGEGEEQEAPAETEVPAGTTAPQDASDTAWITEDVINEYVALDCTDPERRVGGDAGEPDEPLVTCSQDGSAKFILGPVEVQGASIEDASFGFGSTSTGATTNEPVVQLEFNSEGAEAFKNVTSRITTLEAPRNQFGIVLDGLVVSAPVSQAVITDGRAQISGGFTQEEAETLANQLKNGALPIGFQVQTEEQISPTLGADYLTKGLIAGGIGLLLVVAYSLLQYRALGSVTVASLAVAGVLTYLLLLICTWRYGYRLSLAGVAGIIVGIGMTADSFIVYFERIRDEIRSGRNLRSAVEIGWDRARQTIYASKAVNMLAAVILYFLAVGSVRGFAFTLGLTVIVDVLVVILFTHPMMQALAKTKFFGEGHPWSGMDPAKLGVKKSAYRGAMNIDLAKARKAGRKRGSAKEAEKRQTIVERRAEADAKASSEAKEKNNA